MIKINNTITARDLDKQKLSSPANIQDFVIGLCKEYGFTREDDLLISKYESDENTGYVIFQKCNECIISGDFNVNSLSLILSVISNFNVKNNLSLIDAYFEKDLTNE